MKKTDIKSILQKSKLYTKDFSITKINESCNNDVFWHHNLIIKIYHKKKNFQHEVDCLQRLEKYKKDYYPRVLYKNAKNKVLIMTKLPGKLLDTCRLEMPASTQKKMIKTLVDILKEINSIKAKPWHSFAKESKEWLERLVKKSQTNPHIKKSEFNKLVKKIEQYLASSNDKKSVLIHNDMRVKNFLTDGKSITGIIDFENGYYGPHYEEWLWLQLTQRWVEKDIKNDDTSPAEKDFVKKFMLALKKDYPKVFVCSALQKYTYYAIVYLSKLRRYKEKRYRHEEVEKFKSHFLW